MKKLRVILSLSLFITANLGCKDTSPEADFKAILTMGKWLITSSTISPGVRFGNTISSPIITDVKSATSCQDNWNSGAYYYFEEDGVIRNEITCRNSANFGKKVSSGAKWELSNDHKILNIKEYSSSTSFEVISSDMNSFRLMGNTKFRDAYTNKEVLQLHNITFTKF